MAIVTQPGHPGMMPGMPYPGMEPVVNYAGGMMPMPQPMSGCPPGLEYLACLDQVIIKQDVSLLEALTQFEALNSYRILNSAGQQVYIAGEESNCCARQICKTQRGFIYHVNDNFGREVFRVSRDFNLCAGNRACPFSFCRYYTEVTDARGVTMGYVSDRFSCLGWQPLFGLYDEEKTLTAEIKGPCCAIQNCICTDDIDFPVFELSQGQNAYPSGIISKTWEGMLKNCCTTADNFRVTFPVNMDVRTKALMISAVLVIDMMLYEHEEKSTTTTTTTFD